MLSFYQTKDASQIFSSIARRFMARKHYGNLEHNILMLLGKEAHFETLTK